jgi:hypothetical protein
MLVRTAVAVCLPTRVPSRLRIQKLYTTLKEWTPLVTWSTYLYKMLLFFISVTGAGPTADTWGLRCISGHWQTNSCTSRFDNYVDLYGVFSATEVIIQTEGSEMRQEEKGTEDEKHTFNMHTHTFLFRTPTFRPGFVSTTNHLLLD